MATETQTRTPPMEPDTDEADERQLELAKEQGQAYRAAAMHMIEEVAQTGGTKEVGDYVIGYAIEEAEGLYHLESEGLEWREPEDENLHLEIVAMDAADGRFVPGLHIEATLSDADGEEIGSRRMPMLWHPMLLHYGDNWKVPGDGTYDLRVRVAPATFPRHDEVNGKRYGETVEVEFTGIEVETGQD